MGTWSAVGYVVLGGLLGAVGQGLRVVVGIKKNYDELAGTGRKLGDVWDPSRMVTSFVIAFAIGAIAGILGIISFWGQHVTRELIITVLGIGYAGTDFIEGFMKKAADKAVEP